MAEIKAIRGRLVLRRVAHLAALTPPLRVLRLENRARLFRVSDHC